MSCVLCHCIVSSLSHHITSPYTYLFSLSQSVSRDTHIDESIESDGVGLDVMHLHVIHDVHTLLEVIISSLHPSIALQQGIVCTYIRYYLTVNHEVKMKFSYGFLITSRRAYGIVFYIIIIMMMILLISSCSHDVEEVLCLRNATTIDVCIDSTIQENNISYHCLVVTPLQDFVDHDFVPLLPKPYRLYVDDDRDDNDVDDDSGGADDDDDNDDGDYNDEDYHGDYYSDGDDTASDDGDSRC